MCSLFESLSSEIKTRKYLFNRIMLWASLHLLNKPVFPLNAPTGAKIEITNRCNLACRMCLHGSLKKIGDMDFNTYQKIINLLPKSVAWINLTGFGEPLLHNEIAQIIRFTRSKHKYTEIYTNATILDKDMSKNLLASGLDSLHFSIDGATKKTYEYLRVGAKYDEVTQNITEFMAMRKKVHNPPHVVMRVVIMKENLHEAAEVVELAHKLDIRDVRFQALQFFWNYDFSKPEHSIYFLREMDRVRQTFKNAREKAERLGVQLKLPNVNFTTKIRCTQPWYLTCINWQGFVNPCSAVYDVQVGNILNQPFEKIWKGPKLVAWRKQMKSSFPPIQCRNCCDR